MIGYNQTYNSNSGSGNQNLPSVLGFGDRSVKIIGNDYPALYESFNYDLVADDALGLIYAQKNGLVCLIKKDVFIDNSEIQIFSESNNVGIKVGNNIKLLFNGSGYGENSILPIPIGSTAILKRLVKDGIEVFSLTFLTNITSNSILLGLSGKQNKKIIGTGIANAVGTSETLMYSRKIDGGTLAAGSNIAINSVFIKTVGSGTITNLFRLSTDGTIANSVVIATNVVASVNKWMPLIRNTFKITTGNLLQGYNFTTSLAEDNVASNITPSITVFNPANDYWILVTSQSNSLTDNVSLLNITIEI
jgi:hypothetical protein